MKPIDVLVAGCGSIGLPLLEKIVSEKKDVSLQVLALEASSRIGGTSFFASRITAGFEDSKKLNEIEKKIPELKVWWDRSWLEPQDVDWSSKEWAFVLPQWKAYFSQCFNCKALTSSTQNLESQFQNCVQTEQPISEVRFENNTWTLCSGEKTYSAPTLYWTLGLKNFQNCFGKKQAEEFLIKNPDFIEEAREAEGVLAAEYTFPKSESEENTESFVAIPVRFESKLYLSFVYLTAQKVETFTYLHNDLLKNPKELSSYEKALKRSLKHVFSNIISELENPNLGIINEAQGHGLGQPWMLQDCPEKGIFFISEKTLNPQRKNFKEPSAEKVI
jgi:hypothetical protein